MLAVIQGACVSQAINIGLPASQAAAQEGATAPPALEEVVDLHFAALVNRNDRLVELDGRKSFPIDHGKTSASTLLQVPHLAHTPGMHCLDKAPLARVLLVCALQHHVNNKLAAIPQMMFATAELLRVFMLKFNTPTLHN